jgi:hypothetical protein
VKRRCRKFVIAAVASAVALGGLGATPASAHQAAESDPYPHYPAVSQTTNVAPGTILWAQAKGLNEAGPVPGQVADAASVVWCNSDNNIQPQDGRQCEIPGIPLFPVVASSFSPLPPTLGPADTVTGSARAVAGQLQSILAPADGRAACPPTLAQQLEGATCGMAVASIDTSDSPGARDESCSVFTPCPVSFGFRGVSLVGQLPQVDGYLTGFKPPSVKAGGLTAASIKYQVVNGGATTIDIAGALPAHLVGPSTDPVPAAVAPATRGVVVTARTLPAHRLVVADPATDRLARDDDNNLSCPAPQPATPCTGYDVHGLTNGTAVTIRGSAPLPLVLGATYYVVGATANDFQLSATSGGPAIDITAAKTIAVGSKMRYRGGDSLGAPITLPAPTVALPATLLVKKKATAAILWTPPNLLSGSLVRFTLSLVDSGQNPNTPCNNAAPPDPDPPCDLADWNLSNNTIIGQSEVK